MLPLIILFIVILISSVLFYLTYRNIFRINIAPWVFILSIVFVLFGITLLFIQSEEISSALNRQQWPKVNGIVTETKIVGERAYNPEITCKYKVNDSEHLLVTDLSTPGFGRKRSRQSTARIIINEYPVGSSVHIFYNPQNPDVVRKVLIA